MNRSRWKWLALLVLVGLPTAWLAARFGFGAVHAGAAPPASAEQMLVACEQRARGVRLQVFAIEQELQHLDVERRLAGSRAEPAQRQRVTERSAQLAARRQQLSDELAELLQLTEQLRALVAQQALAPSPAPSWLHEARVRVRIDALEDAGR